jgi:3,4-dihydroxy 2-butanone 4-phosphate synthase/GTP cyclohydrolase II
MPDKKLNSTEEIIQDIRLGKMVLLMDDEDRENEGDLVMAAECVTADDINFMARFARGLICLPMSRSHADRLGLRLMVERNGSGFATKFTVSIEAATGVTTGISAADRARTIQAAVARHASSADIVQPGHVFPLIAEPGGVLVRAGHTEAACDLSRLAGFGEYGVICEVMNDDGTMARRPDLERFAEHHRLKIGTIADLIQYRVVNETTIELLGTQAVDSDHGRFVLHTFRDRVNGHIHFAMVRGEIGPDHPVLARVQLGQSARDLLGVRIPGSSGWNVQRALARIAAEGAGVVVLIGGGESASDILESVELLGGSGPNPRPKPGKANLPFMTIGVGSQILRALGLRKLRLMGAPVKYNAISGFNLEVVAFLGPDD